jgi:hypothetical protein
MEMGIIAGAVVLLNCHVFSNELVSKPRAEEELVLP